MLCWKRISICTDQDKINARQELSSMSAKDILLINILFQPVITAIFWTAQCIKLKSKSPLFKTGRCLVFTLIHIGLYVGIYMCSAIKSSGCLTALHFAVSLSCMLGLLWNNFTSETRNIRNASAMLLLFDITAILGFVVYFDFKGGEDELSYWSTLILSVFNYLGFYNITMRRSAR